MTRDYILSGMPDEVAQKVYDNMIEQNEWEDSSDMGYFHESDFLHRSFSWFDSYEGIDYWSDYVEFLLKIDYLIVDCLR